MLIKSLKNCKYFKALEETFICELLHPDQEEESLEMDFSLAHAILEPDESSLPHRMKSSVEVYYILEGKGLMHIENQSAPVESGQAIHIPPNARQWIENIGNTNLKFLCIVKPPWKAEDEELLH